MKLAGIDFPATLMDALRNRSLVMFAGAGVSMGAPAGLPSFKKLAKEIAQGTGVELREDEPEDRFLGRLKTDKRVQVHVRAAEQLKRRCP